jgi:hypothetical protein
MNFHRGWVLGIVSFVAALSLRADDEVVWVQIHADIEYMRTGTASTQKDGHFSYVLKASLDQLMVRVAPNEDEKWPTYVNLDEYPRTGKLSGSTKLTADATFDKSSVSAGLSGALSSLDDLWIEDIKPMPYIFSGIGAEIRVLAKLDGSVKSDLPGDGSKPEAAIMSWPTPVKFDDQLGHFVTDGLLHAYPPFGPRPSKAPFDNLYDLFKGSTDESMPGIGGLTAPAVGAVLNGTPDNWTLTLTREAKPDLHSGGEYSHQVKVVLRLVPTTLPIPKAKPSE